MGVKHNFSQAVSELMGIGRNVDEGEKNNKPSKEVGREQETDVEGLAEEEKRDGKEEVSEGVLASKEKILAMLSQQQPAGQSQPSQPQPVQPSQPQANGGPTPIRVSQPQSVTINPVAKPEPEASVIQQGPKPTAPAAATVHQGPKSEPGVTTIAYGTVIVGEIHAEGDVELLGSVKGKVTSQRDVRVNGKVVGDLVGKDIRLEACAVQGNIVASGYVDVDGESMVIGDVKCENFSLDGKIKGNVVVDKEAKFQPKAILAGNVTTASIAMSQGAKIQGEVNIPLSEKDREMSFDVEITI